MMYEYDLTIVVRHKVGRERQFARCIQSILSQAESEYIQIVILNDEVGRGVDWANANLVEAKRYVKGRHVWTLDDDDVIYHRGVFLSWLAERDRPDNRSGMYIFQFEHDKQGVLPPDEDIESGLPRRGRIAGQCVIVSYDLFMQNIHLSGSNEYVGDYGHSGDYSYIMGCMQSTLFLMWIPEVYAQRQYQSSSDGRWMPELNWWSYGE